MPEMRPSLTSMTCKPHGMCPPAGSGLYWPKAGLPLADVGTRTEPRHALGPGSSMKRPMFSAPWTHMAKGGIDWTASSRNSVTRRSTS